MDRPALLALDRRLVVHRLTEQVEDTSEVLVDVYKRQGVFTVPGDPEGCVDFPTVFKLLDEYNYEGWLVVEAEQDPAIANPLEYARMARAYVKEHTGL